jgi:hypothetical protein
VAAEAEDRLAEGVGECGGDRGRRHQRQPGGQPDLRGQQTAAVGADAEEGGLRQ